MLKTAKYFKGDYIAFGILKTVIATTFAGIILLTMYFLCNAEGLIQQINNLDYVGLAKKISDIAASRQQLIAENQQAQSALFAANRSEERRVGKDCRIGCRSRWSPYH